MYDILQLNDMLVPELLDIAEQQNITNAKKLEKQELIYKILDKQVVMTPSDKKETPAEKPKRKRIAKPVTGAKPAQVVEEKEVKEEKAKKPEEKKKPVKKAKVEEEKIDLSDEDDDLFTDEDGNPVEQLADPKTIAPALLELLKNEDEEEEEQMPQPVSNNGHQHHPKPAQKKEPAFNVEFDGIILAEGVLEMFSTQSPSCHCFGTGILSSNSISFCEINFDDFTTAVPNDKSVL